ncbi:MAG: permease-like cell division protein FtsX [Clostridia bacterium]|nr:permease-like cell division protein FtsX [Clostridia bacterium]
MKLRSVRYLTVEGFKNIWLHRLMTLASVCVLVSCMLLMGVAVLLTYNIQASFVSVKDNNLALVFLDDNINDKQAAEIEKKIATMSNVKKTEYVSREQGAESFRESIGTMFDDLFKNDSTFLPGKIKVTWKDFSKSKTESAIASIKEIKGVYYVNYSKELTKVLNGIQNVINTASLWIIGLLLFTSLVIIANTIRITMAARKLEISIMKAVGATNNFIRFPFIVEGIAFGLISAIASTGILYLIYNSTIDQVRQFGFLSLIPYSSVVWYLFGGFCVIGIVAGTIGSLISISKYLRKEGSEQNAFI